MRTDSQLRAVIPFCSEIGGWSCYVVDSRVCKCGTVGEQWGGGWALTPPCICPRKWTRHVHVSARCIGTAVKFALSAFAHHATVHSLQLPQPCQAIRPSPTPGAHSYRLLAAIEPPRLSGCGALRARSYGQLVGSQSTHSPVSIEGRVLSDISAPKSLVALWK